MISPLLQPIMSATLMSQNGNGLETLPRMSGETSKGSDGEIESKFGWRW